MRPQKFKILYTVAAIFSFLNIAAGTAPVKPTPTPQRSEVKPAVSSVEDEEFELEDPADRAVENDTIENFPARHIYSSWNTQWVNPYKVKIDSIQDSIPINCSDFVYPLTSNRITSQFGMRRYRYHYGIDLGLQVGDTIRSTFSGKVRIVNYESKGYGHYVVVRHDNGLETVSAHLSRVLVKKNQVVAAGEAIGLGGNTGRSTGPHLHYEIRFLGNAFNPNKIINFAMKESKRDVYYITKKETYSHRKELTQLSAARYHTVRNGDTLSGIARRYGTTVSNICKLNKISTRSVIRPGQKIRYR